MVGECRCTGVTAQTIVAAYDQLMADDELVEMTVDSIRVHIPSNQHVVILKEKSAERYLPIWIGKTEASAIALKITGITPERPFTHDLLTNMLSAADVRIDRIVVNSLSKEVFYARILASVDGKTIEVDSRPSDAIAVAVRLGAGIYVAATVLDKAGVLPDLDGEGGEEAEEGDEQTEERLAQIRDWVNTLNLPDLGVDGPPSDPPPPPSEEPPSGS